MTILPISYLPSVEWFAYLAKGDCVVDLGEHFIKRSERNRTRILASDGAMELTVHLRNANRPQTPVRDIRIDYSKRWQHQHWGALVASYKGSAYFDHYAADFEPFYRREWEFLADYNLELLELLCRRMQLPMPAISRDYIDAAESDLDLRPKAADYHAQKKGPTFSAEPYFQVFSDRMAFVPNLSAVDLLFAEGPHSGSVLASCLSEL